MHDPHSAPGEPFNAAEDVDNPSSLFVVYLVVAGLAVATIGLSLLGLGKLALPVQLAISTVQAGVVAYFWMHLRRNDKVVTLCALAGLFWTGILFVLVLSDIMTRYRTGP